MTRSKNLTSYSKTVTYRTDGSQVSTDVAIFQQLMTMADIKKGNFKDSLPYSWQYRRGSGDYFAELWWPSSYGRRQVCIGTQADDSAPSFDTYLYNKALDAFNEKVRGSLDLAIDVATARQTAAMFKPLDRLVRLAKDVVTRRPLEAIRDISGLWLEYVYGWKPLVEDIYGAADNLANHVNNVTSRVAVRKGLPSKSSGLTSWTILAGGSAVKGTLDATTSSFQGCRIEATLTDIREGISTWTSLSPISIAWEVIPYSFVVDWVFNVGSWLRNYETALLWGRPGQKFTISRLARIERVAGPQVSYGWANVPSRYLIVDKRMHRVSAQFSRTVQSTWPTPVRPKFRVNMGTGRLLNAAALLGNLLRR